jgi:CheY-like chemotaxis protein
VLAILQWFLADEGFDVTTASSGPEALQRVEERRPDLIITDYGMPGMTGLALCRWLRAHRETQGIPIILHTAQTLPPTDRLYDRVFTKPSELGELVSEVRALLAHSR